LSIFKKIQEKLIPTQHQVENATPIFTPKENIKHEFVDFSSAYRIGILCYFTDYNSQEQLNNYKKELEKLGYECEILLFIDKREKENNIYLQSFNWDDLDRRTMLPNSPRTDRFIVKRFDLLFNLYLQPCLPLQFVSNESNARCRVGPFVDKIKDCCDLLIPIDQEYSLDYLIQQINFLLKLKPYERKQI